MSEKKEEPALKLIIRTITNPSRFAYSIRLNKECRKFFKELLSAKYTEGVVVIRINYGEKQPLNEEAFMEKNIIIIKRIHRNISVNLQSEKYCLLTFYRSKNIRKDKNPYVYNGKIN